jgi:hypothetical protein
MIKTASSHMCLWQVGRIVQLNRKERAALNIRRRDARRGVLCTDIVAGLVAQHRRVCRMRVAAVHNCVATGWFECLIEPVALCRI